MSSNSQPKSSLSNAFASSCRGVATSTQPKVPCGYDVRSAMAAILSQRAQVLERQPELVRHPLRDERAVAGFGVALDAEERGRAVGRQRRDDRLEVDLVETFAGVALDVVRREP